MGEKEDQPATLARLDAAFAGQRAMLSKRQLEVARAWQRTSREYELTQAVVRSELDLDQLSRATATSALDFQEALDSAIRSARLPFPLTVYRGIRSIRRTFGSVDPQAVVGRHERLAGYVATSALRSVALAEFTAPGGALLEIAVPADTNALWIAGVGSSRLRRQAELLFGDNLHIGIGGCRREGDLPVLSIEVMPE